MVLRNGRRLVAYLAMLMLAAVLILAPGARAALAACPGCDGADPYNNNCTNAATMKEFTAYKTSVRIELRASGACSGAWVRSTQPGSARYGTKIFLESYHDGLRYSKSIGLNSQDVTPMMNWSRTVRACYGWVYEGPSWNDYDVFECTAWW